mgnify:CR=1 FL=1
MSGDGVISNGWLVTGLERGVFNYMLLCFRPRSPSRSNSKTKKQEAIISD